jgi:AcrR family transcriptional regulator
MPPKQKFTKEEIILTALEIIKQDGLTALTARRLGAELNSSSRPIFTVFQSMDEVQKEAVMAARALYNQYVAKGLAEAKAFKGVGQAYIQFAKKESKLFQVLFMTENGDVPELKEILSIIDDNSKLILETIQNDYGLEEAKARMIYQNLWIFTHGIATMCATRVCQFSDSEIDSMLSDVFISILQRLKDGDKA